MRTLVFSHKILSTLSERLTILIDVVGGARSAELSNRFEATTQIGQYSEVIDHGTYTNVKKGKFGIRALYRRYYQSFPFEKISLAQRMSLSFL